MHPVDDEGSRNASENPAGIETDPERCKLSDSFRRNASENPAGIETMIVRNILDGNPMSQRIRKPSRDWNGSFVQSARVGVCRNASENPAGIETKELRKE